MMVILVLEMGVWCADRNLTRNLGMVVGMVGKNVGVQVRPDVV